MKNQGSKDDKKYGLEPGEFERIKKEHRETFDGKDYVSESLTQEERSKSRKALGGAAKWDDKSYVEMRHRKELGSSTESVWGQKERLNFRMPFLFPTCCIGLAIYGYLHFGRDGFGIASWGWFLVLAIPVLICSWAMSRKGGGFGIGLGLAVMTGLAVWAVNSFLHPDIPLKGAGSSAEGVNHSNSRPWVPPPRKLSPREKKDQEDLLKRQNERLERVLSEQSHKSGQ